MGIFKKLFGKKETKNESNIETTNNSYEEEWEFYFSNIEDVIGSIFLDLGFADIAPVIDKPNMVWIALTMNNPREDGLSSDEEYDKLEEIENRLIKFITSKHSTFYVGRITSDSDRIFYFYFGDIILYDKTISEAMVAFPNYKYEFGTEEDKEWESYLEYLYPSPIEFQSIQNRKVVDSLEENGDPLTKERQVNHWIYFITEKDRENFLTKIENDGFDIINKDFIKDDDDTSFPYSLQIARIDKVDIVSVNDYILNLWELATECNGNYDGWETSIEKD